MARTKGDAQKAPRHVLTLTAAEGRAKDAEDAEDDEDADMLGCASMVVEPLQTPPSYTHTTFLSRGPPPS